MPPEGRLLFIGLWCLADREGKLEDRPKRIKGEIFRFDNISSDEIDELLIKLSNFKLIIRYEVDRINYIKIPTFLIHQRPHHNEKPSTIPEPLSTKGESTCYQGNKQKQPKDKALRSDTLNPDTLNNKSGILNPDSKDIAPPGPSDPGSAVLFFSCSFFDVTMEYREKLAQDYPAMTDPLLRLEFSKMEDWLTDNPKPKRATGKLKNARLFIRNWIGRTVINPQGGQRGVPLNKADQVTMGNMAAAGRLREKWKMGEEPK